MINPSNLIPDQQQGTAVNVEESLNFDNDAASKDFFETVKNRLLQINNWGELAGALSATFQLTNSDGVDKAGVPQEGDHFKISIPAPGIITGSGYDWVRVEKVEEEASEEKDFVAIRVRPASNPTNDEKDVAHFYTDAATSNFMVTREGKKITAGVYGRNEKPNVEEAENLLDKARNAIVGTGAVSGFSKLQWQGLVSGLLSRDE